MGSYKWASHYTFQIRFASFSAFVFSKNHWAGMTLQRSPNPSLCPEDYRVQYSLLLPSQLCSVYFELICLKLRATFLHFHLHLLLWCFHISQKHPIHILQSLQIAHPRLSYVCPQGQYPLPRDPAQARTTTCTSTSRFKHLNMVWHT